MVGQSRPAGVTVAGPAEQAGRWSASAGTVQAGSEVASRRVRRSSGGQRPRRPAGGRSTLCRSARGRRQADADAHACTVVRGRARRFGFANVEKPLIPRPR